jgi:hypothetical protein
MSLELIQGRKLMLGFDLQALPDRFDLRLLGICQIQLLPDSSMMMVVPIIMRVVALSEEVASVYNLR